MFTIKELEDKWTDYESACLLTIRQLLTDCKEVIFKSNDLGMHPVCIGDTGNGLIDGIINSIYLDNNEIYISYQDKDYPEFTMDEAIQYINHINYIELINFIKEELKNGKINLGTKIK